MAVFPRKRFCPHDSGPVQEGHLVAVARQQFVMLDFSVPELVRSQLMFSTDPEVIHNYAGFTLCSSVGRV